MGVDRVISTKSIIVECCERIRQDLDEPSVDAKFSDNWIARMNLMPAMAECMSLVNLQSDQSVLFRLAFPLVAGTEYYQLPPCVSSVMRVAKLDQNGAVTTEWIPRGSDFNPAGVGWAIEGNTLAFRPYPAQNDAEWLLYYVPSADFKPHYSEGGAVAAADGDDVFRLSATLDASTDIGEIDNRENAYVGQVLRVLSGDTVIERIIDEHYFEDAMWKVHTRVAFDLDDDDYSYEIVPFVASHFWVMASRKAAIDLGNSRNVPDSQMRRMYLSYESARKCVLDTLSNMQGRIGKSFASVTQDQPRQVPNWFNQMNP